MKFSSSFKSGKCKTSLKLVISRIKLLKNRREALVSQLRGEVAQLLLANQDQNARIRVEHVIREDKVRSAYDIIEVYCELLGTRLQVLDFQKNCPIDLKEAVASLIFAAPRCADIPELLDVRKHLASKYGKEFEKAALEVRPDSGVSPLIVENLSAGAPDIETKVKVLRSIAKETGVKWEPKSFGETLERPRQENQNRPISLESPRAPVVETVNPEIRSNQKLELDEKNKTTKWSWAARSSSGSANKKSSAAEYGSQPQPTIQEQRPRGYGSSQSQENRSMEFTDAAMAAKVAAESAEKACMAAKAAAELAYREQRRRESRGEYVLDGSYVTDYSYSLNFESENSHGSAKIRTERSMPASFGVEDSKSEYAFSQRSISERRATTSKLQRDMFMNNNNSENGREKEFAMSYASERSVPASYDMDESEREYAFSESRSSERQATRSRLQKDEVVNNNYFEKQREKVYAMRYASERENFRLDNETTYDARVVGGRNQEHENYTSNNFTNNGREQDEWDLHEGTSEKVDGDGFRRSSGAFSAGYDRQEVGSLSREKESALSDLSLQHCPRRSKQQVKEYPPKDVPGLSNHSFPRTKGREVQGRNRKPAVPRYDSDSNSSEGDQTEASVRSSAPRSVAEPADYSSSESGSVLSLGRFSGGLRNKHYDQSSTDDNTSHIKVTISSQDDLGRNLSVKSNDTMTLLLPSKLKYNSRKEFEAPNLCISPDTYRRKEAEERSSSPPVSSPNLKNRPRNSPPERPVVKPNESSDRKPSSREEDKPQKKYMQISESNIGRNLSVQSNETTALPAHIHQNLPDSDKLFAHFRALRANARGK